MSDWPELYREVTVRVSRRGKIQLKLLLQTLQLTATLQLTLKKLCNSFLSFN